MGFIKVIPRIKGSGRGSFLMSKHQSLSAWSVQRRSTWINRNQANVAPAPAIHSERSNATNAKVLAPIRNALRPKRLYWRNRSSIRESNKHRSSNKRSNGRAKQNLHGYSWTKERKAAAIAELRRTERKLARSRRLRRIALQNYISMRHGRALPGCNLAQPDHCWALSRGFAESRIRWTGSKAEEQSSETRWSRNDSAVILTDLVRMVPCFKQMIRASGKRLLESFHWYWAVHSPGWFFSFESPHQLQRKDSIKSQSSPNK